MCYVLFDRYIKPSDSSHKLSTADSLSETLLFTLSVYSRHIFCHSICTVGAVGIMLICFDTFYCPRVMKSKMPALTMSLISEQKSMTVRCWRRGKVFLCGEQG